MKTLWVRADDVGQAPEQFRQFHAELLRRGIPVTYAAIPGLLTADDVAWLRNASVEGCAVVQHGFMHADYSGQVEPRYKYEFGPNRSPEEQERDIRQGARLMDAYLGEAWTRAFVPPWHGFDVKTLDILQRERYGLLSTSVFEEQKLAGNSLPWAPVHVMVDLDSTIRLSAERVMNALMTREQVGVLFHPADLAKPEASHRLHSFLDFLQEAVRRTGARFGTIREVMALAAPAR